MVVASQKCHEYAQEFTLIEILCKYSHKGARFHIHVSTYALTYVFFNPPPPLAVGTGMEV